jgi:hypothetical protein
MRSQLWSENPLEGDKLQDLRLDLKIKIKWIFSKLGGGYGLDGFTSLRIRTNGKALWVLL